jgi:RNA polymerase sigma factor for flagellar operon FliA
MPLDELKTIRGDMMPPPVQINAGSDRDSENAINLDMLPTRDDVCPVKEAQRADLREFLTRGLSETERRVVILYYYENMSLREIGATLELCESRVSQIHHAVIKRLRERMHRIGGASIEE